jgi:hypothetical protein
VLNLSWLQDGMLLSGDSFFVNGTMDNPTAQITVQMADTNGVTNVFNGLVERDGKFWVEHLPLAAGTNALTLTAVDRWGNSATTNLSVIKSDLLLTMNVDASLLYQDTIPVSGTVSEPGCAIWVNGVQATTSGGAWNAANVPVNAGNTAVFAASAYPPGGGGPANLVTEEDKQPRFYVCKYTRKLKVSYADLNSGSSGGFGCEGTWTDGSASQWSAWTTFENPRYPDSDLYCQYTYTWPKAYWPPDNGTQVTTCTGQGNGTWTNTNQCGPPFGGLEDAELDELPNIPGEKYEDAYSVEVVMKLFTGGKATLPAMNLFIFNGHANAEVVDGFFVPTSVAPGSHGSVGCANITLGGLGNLGSDCTLAKALQCGLTMDVPVSVKGTNNYKGYGVGMSPFFPHITANEMDLRTNTPEFCVGQQVTFKLKGLPDYVNMVGNWKLPGEFKNEPYQYSSTCTSYRINDNLLKNTDTTSCWYVNKPGGTVSVGMSLLFANGQTVGLAAAGHFTIVKPSIVGYGPLTNAIQASFHTNNGVSTECNLICYTQVQPPQPFSGTLTYVQLVNRYATYSAPDPVLGICWSKSPDSTGGAYWLDNNCPYPDDPPSQSVSWNQSSAPFFYHKDSPDYEGFCNSISVNDKFQAYLQFQPSAGIPVTIQRIDWGWTCNATECSGIWTWNLSTNGPTWNNDDSFPVWPDVYHNKN